MRAFFRRSLRCETLLYFSTAAVSRLDLVKNPRASLGPGFFRNLLVREVGNFSVFTFFSLPD